MPARRCALTSSWTSAVSATCTAIAAACRSCRDSLPDWVTKLRLTGDLGPDVNLLAEAGILEDYRATVEAAHAASARVAAGSAPEAAQNALYLLPLATRVRCLFKMDFAEAQYISELRSAPAGHFSYRRVAWEMCLALQRQYPSLAKHIRATDFSQPIDLLQR